MILKDGKEITFDELDIKYTQYATNILNGSIPSCEYIKLSCKRMMSRFNRSDMYFDCDAVDKVERFISKLKHYSGEFKDKPFLLLDWQYNIIVNIFGWKWVSNNKRVTRRAFVEITRKCGKTALISAIMLYMFIAEGEGEAQIACVSPSYKQSQLLFQMASNYLKPLDPKRRIFKSLREEIKFDATHSWFKCFAAVPDKLDGFGISSLAIDEAHEIKTPDLYNVGVSSMGARSQPLVFCITTAGFHKEYWYYKQRQTNIENLMLDKDDGTFFVCYTLDNGDEWEDENNWVKAIPSLKTKHTPNGTVNLDYIQDQVQQAKDNPTLRNGVLTKNLNIWCDAETTWISNDNIVKVTDKKLKLEDFRGMEAFVGLDLSAVSDLTTISVMIPLDGKFYFWTYPFLPSDTVQTSQNSTLYKYWRDTKQLNVTDGNVQDLDMILKKVIEIGKIVNIQSVGFDSWGITQLAIKAQDTEIGNLLTPISQSVGNFSRGHKMLETIILNQSAVLEDNEVVRWNFSNIIVKEDINGNCKGQKNFDEPDKKIDSYISMVECLLLYLDSPMNNNELFVL